MSAIPLIITLSGLKCRTELKRIVSNVGVYYTTKFQNKQALVTTKHCTVWQIKMITEHVIAE